MSDQQHRGTGATLGLEELFFSREFGRRPARGASCTAATAAVAEPVQLEQVFLSEVFGHPEVMAPAFPVVAVSTAPVVSGRPALVLLKGGAQGSSERDGTRYRAIAAVSGVAAAALVVAGLASGTGQRPGQPTISAQGVPSGQNVSGLSAGAQPAPVAPGAGAEPAPPASGVPDTPAVSGGGAPVAHFTSFTTTPPPASVAGAGAPDVPSGGAPAAPTPGSGTSPGAPTSSGSGMLAPVLDVVGKEVSSVGSAVTATSTAVGQALPVSSITGALGKLATSAVNNLGGGSPPTILAGALR